MTPRYDVAVIGGGPAGLAAALAAEKQGAGVLLVEREARLGGILKQCIHDGFGLIRFGEKLSGPEYAHRFTKQLPGSGIATSPHTFCSSITAAPGGFQLALSNRTGFSQVQASKLVLATGCRERTAHQVAIHGTRPAGIFTAGTAQYYVNILGQMPTKRCVVLGSGDIGLIMARRLTLEGAEVLGVYEVKQSPGGLLRNLAQCLEDFDIPLHLSHTVTRVLGHRRLEAVEVAAVDAQMRPVPGSEQIVECDALILSVGLIPENELAESLGLPLCPTTKGPICDQYGQSLVPGVFCCGNATHVNDLVDDVSENGERAGRAAAAPQGARQLAAAAAGEGVQYVFPQRIDLSAQEEATRLYFRTAQPRGQGALLVQAGGATLLRKAYRQMRPPEIERVDLGRELLARLKAGDALTLALEDT